MHDFSLKLIVEGPGDLSPALCAWFAARAPQVRRVAPSAEMMLLTPETGDVKLFNDGPAPALLAEIELPDEGSADTVMAAGGLAAAAAGLQADFPSITSISAGNFHIMREPVCGVVAARSSPLSFVVRYYGPTGDDGAFADHYVANHPPILAEFPAIRNVVCYLPRPLHASGLQQSDMVLSNEVVFDDLAALNEALCSEVVGKLRADSVTFPPFGHSTHHAMRRDFLA